MLHTVIIISHPLLFREERTRSDFIEMLLFSDIRGETILSRASTVHISNGRMKHIREIGIIFCHVMITNIVFIFIFMNEKIFKYHM